MKKLLPVHSDVALANLAYYEANAKKYAESTLNIDLAHLYEPFLALLPSRARILDVGCGGGRDLKAFRDRGFKPVGIDPSIALANIAREYSGVEVAVAKVEDIEFTEEFDAVWACASLLHLPKKQLPVALMKIKQSILPGGVLYLSVQSGSGEEVLEDGRFYTFYTDTSIRKLIKASELELLRTWMTADSYAGRNRIIWLNLLARKPLHATME
jgi:SAM-dependent methyltransferase